MGIRISELPAPATTSLQSSDLIPIVRSGTTYKLLGSGVAVPVGTVITFAGTGVPDGGWILCNGAELNATTSPEYTNLYNAIVTTYGGTGSSKFNVPDLQGIFIRGSGTSNTYKNAAGSFLAGGNLASTSVDAYRNHGHAHNIGVSINSANTTANTFSSKTFAGQGSNYAPAEVNKGTGTVAVGASITGSISDSTTGGTETKPASISLKFYIKY